MSEAPIRVGHADRHPPGCTCGCCDGTAVSTPVPTENRPGLSAIAFRTGDHGRFKASMLSNLASSAHPALARLGTRDDDDFSIALIDAWASACDVLSFYQERLANEAYMRTARERFSVGELARLIGYRLHPGSAAETDLVLLMDDPPGAEPDVTDLTVPAGTRVQSQPGPDEEAQVFETLDDISARVAWNQLLPRLSRRILPKKDDISVWLAGTPALAVGDAVLIVGSKRGGPAPDPGSELWDFRRLTAIEAHADLNRTKVTFDRKLGSDDPFGLPAQDQHRFFHLRDRAALFGYNAPDPRAFSGDQQTHFQGDLNTAKTEWLFALPGTKQIALDGIYKSFVKDSWVVLTLPSGFAELYRIEGAHDDGRKDYAISGKATLLSLDTDEGLDHLENGYRAVSAYGGSVEIPFADTPETGWVAGSEVELDARADGLPKGRKLIFRGRRARLEVTSPVLNIQAEDGALRAVTIGARLTLMGEPETVPGQSEKLWTVKDADGFLGTTEALDGALRVVPAEKDAEEVVEVAILDHVVAGDTRHSTLVLTTALNAAFDRTSLVIHANVARAAHGEGVTDILGAGDPSLPFQKFLLKQSPVTHRLAATEAGVISTLNVRVDGVAWDEVPDLYYRGANARVFKTSLTNEGGTIVEFGDGISGARPMAGRDNIVADYSKGIGLAGNLRAGQLVLPLDRPLGLRETLNPLPATGGDDPESADDARRNAPIYTLTLGRVVSITDYRDFALGFPGIAKAEAHWIWQGEGRRIVVTVAGPGGKELPPGSSTYDNLLKAYRKFGDPLVGFDLLSFKPVHFRLGLRVATDPAHVADDVLAAVDAAMHEAFSFEARDFGQTVALSEVAEAAHAVPGVTAVDTDLLYRESPPQDSATAHPILSVLSGRLGPDEDLLPAEILTLLPGPLEKLEVMS